ncbi:MAG TPA: LPS export ABC transporter permease LptG [bacterium]|nr:LPS export ABC transporter permease LptG [bacterium]
MWVLIRYTVSEFIKRFFLFLCILICLFVGIDLLSRIWSINAPLSTTALYYFFRVPQVGIQMVPVSILLATLLFFSYMSKHNEIVALYTSGRSLFRISSPILLLVIVISIMSFFFSDYLLPIANFKAQKIWMVDIMGKEGEFYDSLHQKRAWFRDKDVIYNVSSYDSKSKAVSGLSLYSFDGNFKMKEHIYAKGAVYEGKRQWLLKDVRKTSFIDGKATTELVPEINIGLREVPDDFKRMEARSEHLTASRLKKYISDLKDAGISPAKYEVEYHKRYSLAFAGLVMCFIAIPFAVRQQRRGGVAINIGAGFVLVFAYWVLFSMLLSLGMSGRIWAPMSAWGANIIFIGLSVFLVRKMKK